MPSKKANKKLNKDNTKQEDIKPESTPNDQTMEQEPQRIQQEAIQVETQQQDTTSSTQNEHTEHQDKNLEQNKDESQEVAQPNAEEVNVATEKHQVDQEDAKPHTENGEVKEQSHDNSDKLKEIESELSKLNSIVQEFVENAHSLQQDALLTAFEVVPQTADLSHNDGKAITSFQNEYRKNISEILSRVQTVVDGLYKDRASLKGDSNVAVGSTPSIKLQELSDIIRSTDYSIELSIIDKNNDNSVIEARNGVNADFETFKTAVLGTELAHFSEDEKKYVQMLYCISKIGESVERELQQLSLSQDKLNHYTISFAVVKKTVESLLEQNFVNNPKSFNLDADFRVVNHKEVDEINRLTSETHELTSTLNQQKEISDAATKHTDELKQKYESELANNQSQIESLKNEIKASETAIQTLNGENQALTTRTNELTAEVETLNQVQNALSQSEDLVRSQEHQIQEKSVELIRLKELKVELEAHLKAKSDEVEKLSQIIAENEVFVEKLKKEEENTKMNAVTLESKVIELENENKSLKDNLEQAMMQLAEPQIDEQAREKEENTAMLVEALKTQMEDFVKQIHTERASHETVKDKMSAKIAELKLKEAESVHQISDLAQSKRDLEATVDKITKSVDVSQHEANTKTHNSLLIAANGVFVLGTCAYLFYARRS